MKRNFITKTICFFIIISIISMLFCTYSTNANTFNIEDINLSDDISEQDAKVESKIENMEEKIIKYDATTGETTEIDLEELKSKINLLNAIGNENLSNSTKGYDPYSSKYLDNNDGTITPNALEDYFFTKVYDTSVYPYRDTCRLIIDGGMAYGSGYLVGPNVMLTAAHCVYNSEKDNEPRQFIVYPGYNNGSYKGYSSGWQAIYRSSIWLETHNKEYDWALVELKEDLGNKVGWYGTVNYYSNSSLKDVPVKSLGYPADFDLGKCQYYTMGKINNVYTRDFTTTVGNKGGMSGGPIIINDSNNEKNEYAVGIVQGNKANSPLDQTHGVRLNDYLINLIRDYINKY